ncbi:MAG: bifunctional UDP-N-acetylglucosamine diphosphorylase/glucosamine-1-phosphate N-acetyltransferase GlmU [Legionellaceae bacterium]|nr:bifunctional UDP-N-acetylglucosamine diphosphorylase/glucosamine-1-phosphate N-acetyltransferase GlmU [Legionellaceae bacterium]
MSLHIIILAAGMGTRMHSDIPKVLHKIGGMPMFEHVIKTAMNLNPAMIHAIIGHQAEYIKQVFNHLPINWVKQTEQLGTGHAVLQALPNIPTDATVLILSADVPLIKTDTICSLINSLLNKEAPSSFNADIKNEAGQDLNLKETALGLLVTTLPNPFGLGRILRNEFDKICAIIEEKDASAEQKKIREIYTGICCVKAIDLKRWLPRLGNNNAQKEYYLTEIIAMAVADKLPIYSIEANDPMDVQGVNDRVQLQMVERAFQSRIANQLMQDSVTLADATRIDVRGELKCGRDVFIDINNLFRGNVSLGNNCIIEPNCILTNVTVGDNCKILANSILEDCVIGDGSHVGPFTRIRPGTRLAENCKIGNFVEAKNAVFGAGSKASHLSYLGDVTLGSDVNIGAGTITCNYDGANKHHTEIEDGVHIGSDTQLVAPVTIGRNATIGAGSTIRKNVPPGELTLTTSVQKTIYGWTRPTKKSDR